MARLPDFVVIGAAKSATTTLYAWLHEQPEVVMSEPKEPAFFAKRWDLGLDWYRSLFDAPDGVLTGEASTIYTQPPHDTTVARRMADVVPDARLVYVVRHPIDRLLSHYAHSYRKGRIGKNFEKAMTDPHSVFVGTSCYHERLSPFIAAFPREQICVVRTEDLVASDDESGWTAILRHLGLPSRPRPTGAHNVAWQPRQSRAVLRVSGARRRLRVPAPPRWTQPVTR